MLARRRGGRTKEHQSVVVSSSANRQKKRRSRAAPPAAQASQAPRRGRSHPRRRRKSSESQRKKLGSVRRPGGDGEDELVGAVLGGAAQARHRRGTVGDGGGRLGGVRPAAREGEGVHGRRRAWGSGVGATLLQRQT